MHKWIWVLSLLASVWVSDLDAQTYPVDDRMKVTTQWFECDGVWVWDITKQRVLDLINTVDLNNDDLTDRTRIWSNGERILTFKSEDILISVVCKRPWILI